MKWQKVKLGDACNILNGYAFQSEQYKNDSVISDELNYELINHLEMIQNGEIKPKEMFG